MSLSSYQRIAKRAIDAYLHEHADREAFPFIHLAEGVAEQAARTAGKKRELFASLWDYEPILPVGAEVFWNAGLAKVHNPYYEGMCELEAQVAGAGMFDSAIDLGPRRTALAYSV